MKELIEEILKWWTIEGIYEYGVNNKPEFVKIARELNTDINNHSDAAEVLKKLKDYLASDDYKELREQIAKNHSDFRDKMIRKAYLECVKHEYKLNK